MTSHLAIIIIKINMAGAPNDVMPDCTATTAMLSFLFASRRAFRQDGIRRRELVAVLETVGGLMLVDGIREVGVADIYRVESDMGGFSLKLRS